MRRSYIARKPDSPRLRRKALERRAEGPRRLRRRVGVNKQGKKGRKWARVRAECLKPRFRRAGIIYCEGRFPGCWVDNGLGFAHRFKRRNIHTDEELKNVVLLCNHCHDFIELQGEEKMGVEFDLIVERRRLAA